MKQFKSLYMKKMMLALALFVTVGISAAFASEGEVSQKVLNSFKQEFSTAVQVTWTTSADYYKASFTLNGLKIFAYYSPDGELLGVSRYISSLQLPLQLLTQLKNSYTEYWITDLFELSNHEGTQYYVTLENADSSIVLKSEGLEKWHCFSKRTKV